MSGKIKLSWQFRSGRELSFELGTMSFFGWTLLLAGATLVPTWLLFSAREEIDRLTYDNRYYLMKEERLAAEEIKVESPSAPAESTPTVSSAPKTGEAEIRVSQTSTQADPPGITVQWEIWIKGGVPVEGRAWTSANIETIDGQTLVLKSPTKHFFRAQRRVIKSETLLLPADVKIRSVSGTVSAEPAGSTQPISVNWNLPKASLAAASPAGGNAEDKTTGQ
jgi:hypothetical protein